MPDEAAAGLEESLLEVVRDQRWMARGRASRRRRFPRLYAMTPKSKALVTRTGAANPLWRATLV
jgi:hypothetical protein